MDGLIAADPGVIWLAKKHCPSVPLHLSTQAHSVNGAAVAFWREAGVERINLARELGFKQIRALAEAFPGVDFEVFVHGAMCLALSGHCLLSAWVNNRPANQGRCTQPCRFEYRGLSLLVEEQKRSGEALWEIREGEAFSGFWAPQDLCLLRYVGCLADLGVRALKLEGRTKSGGYVAQIADVYRTALDRHARREAGGPDCGKVEISTAALLEELFHTASRPLSTGFFLPRRRVEAPPAGLLPRPVVARLAEPEGDGWRVQVRSRGHRIVKRPFSCRGCGVRHFSRRVSA
ncbi:MAG: peptidase U32 family protein [Bilophila wadsworthia]